MDTRGERNRNPGNIVRDSTRWKGMSADQSGDARFIVFTDSLFGLRAIGRCLLAYSHLYKPSDSKDIDTVEEIINRWAPSSENDTKAYIDAVSKEVGVNADTVIDIADESVMCKLVTAIVRHENGRVIYAPQVIEQAVKLALS